MANLIMLGWKTVDGPPDTYRTTASDKPSDLFNATAIKHVKPFVSSVDPDIHCTMMYDEGAPLGNIRYYVCQTQAQVLAAANAPLA